MADKELSDEIERLRKLEQEGILCSSTSRRDDPGATGQPESCGGSQSKSDRTRASIQNSRRKRSRHSLVQREDVVTPSNDQADNVVVEPAENLNKEPLPNRNCINTEQVCLSVIF